MLWTWCEAAMTCRAPDNVKFVQTFCFGLGGSARVEKLDQFGLECKPARKTSSARKVRVQVAYPACNAQQTQHARRKILE